MLTVAAAGAEPLRGALPLGVYAAGMTAPLLVLAAAWRRFNLGRRTWLRERAFHIGPVHLHTTSTIGGLLFIGIGVTFAFFGGVSGLPTVSPRLALRVENATAALAGHVPDIALLLVLAGVVMLVLRYRLRRGSAKTRSAVDDLGDVQERGDSVPPPSRTLPTVPRSRDALQQRQ